jgi:malonyl-CoA O-methyltransferase
MINKEYKRKSFNRAATTYDSFAILQDTISNKLFDRLKKINLSPLEILDLGCGTGTNGVNLKKQYEKSRIINYDFSENMLSEARLKQKIFILNQINPSPYSYICGDIEAIPLKENSLDLVWSSSTLQWCNELDLVFNQVKKILKPGGLFIFSTFGPNTLNELREITENLFNEKRTSTFIDIRNVDNLLIDSHFSNPVLEVENFTMTYNEVGKLFMDIKSIGATNGNISKAKGLSGRSFTKKIIEKYEEYRKNKLLPASYEVIYGHAWNIPKTISEYQQIKFKDG